jgi:integrase
MTSLSLEERLLLLAPLITPERAVDGGDRLLVAQPVGDLGGISGIAHVKFHALRHSAATLLLSQGVHPKIVADMLGHSTIALTMDVYSHVTLEMQHEAAETMDRLFRA